MTATGTRLELLSPAKNVDFGIAAIDHGADAVYIGGPLFGARASAGNAVADIERLAAYAHRFSAKVLVALNTILKDEELESARRLAWAVYEAGADALILQDMGLLELDMPPIELHASTQTDNRSVEKVRFLEQVGFSQVVLARELSLPQIRTIAAGTTATLEFFVHGALCVSYSGQCNISHAYTGRSANRGECSQACRLPYTLADGEGHIVAHEQHLLSMKDNDQSGNLRALVEAGIRSFKIEGRLKDLSYVKNTTAHYRKLLDGVMAELPEFRRSSSGFSTFTFEPQPEKTFNRGATDYFVTGRKTDIGAFESPAFAGEPIGCVTAIASNHFELDGDQTIHNGDGFSYFDSHQELAGLRINRAEGRRLFPLKMPDDLVVGTALYRNLDHEFERLLERKSAERKIRVRLHFAETSDGFNLQLIDEEDHVVSAAVAHAKEMAKRVDGAAAAIREHLTKFGNTRYESLELKLDLSGPWFIPAAVLNGLRRQAVECLDQARLGAYGRAPRLAAIEPPAIYPEGELSYLGNVLNRRARDFYTRHGVSVIDDAYEANREPGAVSLMITKHCLRYSFNLCPKQVPGIRAEPMTLKHGSETLTLRFDCKRCEMHVVGRLKKHRVVRIEARAPGVIA
jgi:collagenase-like PrtC family protease